jgi:hypothetical protein
MPSEFPGSPKVAKGALVVFGTQTIVPTSVIAFQYNPDTLSRDFQLDVADQGVMERSVSSGLRQALAFPPIERFRVSVDLDAADQLEAQDGVAARIGLHPALAALELLLYPPTPVLLLNQALAAFGSWRIKPAETPLVLFVWGRARVVPVRIRSLGVAEQAFDEHLNPIQATVDLEMETLTANELEEAGLAFEALVLGYQLAKETAAAIATTRAAPELLGAFR